MSKNNSSKESTKVPGGLNFVFDIVIVKLILTHIEVEDPTKLRVEAKFTTNLISITPSRINVNEFVNGRSLELVERSAVLRTQLKLKPLECSVFYDNRCVGGCSFLWPSSFLDCIGEGCGKELKNCDGADVVYNSNVVGRLEISSRLRIKCGEIEEVKEEPPKVDICKMENFILNPNDVIFVVGENKLSSIPCDGADVIPGSEDGSSRNATCLDLSGFRHVHGKTVPNTEILDCVDANCCKAKNCSNQMKQFSSLIDQPQAPPCSSKIDSKPCGYNKEKKPNDCISENRYSSSSSDSSHPYCCMSDEIVAPQNDKHVTCQCQVQDRKRTKRFCPLCSENITWLPKYVACPKCGFRPISYEPEEKPYDDTLTSTKILEHFIPADDTTTAKDDQLAGSNRCTCKNGVICAHCRIKKLCEDIFKPKHRGEGDCGKCESKTSNLYNICRTSSHDCRPYLTKVFHELKTLFDMTEDTKSVASRKDFKKISKNVKDVNKFVGSDQRKAEPEICNKVHKNIDEERKKFLVKNFQKYSSCKSKVFDYNKQRTYPGTKIGHKTCFTGRKWVPSNMGWLWNIDAYGQRAGWMPGAIRKPIKVLMQHFLNGRQYKYENRMLENCEQDENEEKDYTKEPTLHICKKKSVYYITLRPLKDIETLRNCTDPMMQTRPIQFKITKNPCLTAISEVKQYLKDIGFAKCVCHKPITECCCRSFFDKKKLEYECCKECSMKNMPNCADRLILSDTTESEAEFDFGVTPPAGVVRKSHKKKKRRVSTGTQYVEEDCEPKDEYPKPPYIYAKLHNCAIGNRFGKAFGPYGTKGFQAGACPRPASTNIPGKK